MLVGVPKEIKPQENRVGLIPAGVRQLVSNGHDVIVEQSAGAGSGIPDDEYIAAGAEIVSTAEEVWTRAEMIWKVKEPIAPEYPRMQDGQILYTYLHLAPDRPQTDALLSSGVVGIAYETVQDPDGSLPLLTPMSEVAGRLSVQAGARCLERVCGGRGVLLGGVPGVPPGKVVVIGGGIVGLNAVRMAMGMGADVTVLDISLDRLRWFDNTFQGRVKTLYSSAHNLEVALGTADLVVGAVLVAGASPGDSPHLSLMQPGAAIVDVARPRRMRRDNPPDHTRRPDVVDGIVHYAVANMPGAVARTSTFALNNATMRQGVMIANMGWEAAIAADLTLRPGVNVANGKITYEAVAKAHGLDHPLP